jgi:N-carbamoyl-L-amino-acid hydrolase
VGVYHGLDTTAPRLLTGSHYDTVRNGGKHDGRLGIFVPMACVKALHAQGRRLKHGIEVVGFAEEEGQRYKATFLGSGALVGDFHPEWLDLADADGITVRQAMQAAGLSAKLDDIAALKRDPKRYLGFVEVHIEQGPVLNELDMPLGVVTSINGSLRFAGEAIGVACHAGTTPMPMRQDAAAAVAELLLYVEHRAAQDQSSPAGASVGTVGVLQVPQGSLNVVPGRCLFTLDLRAPTNAQRDALAQDVLAFAQALEQRRGVRIQIEPTMAASAAPSDDRWQQRWAKAVHQLGLPIFKLPSGAGHDAMKLHELMPQAMLFVRGGNAGISHNPLESITNDDAQLCVDAFMHLLNTL